MVRKQTQLNRYTVNYFDWHTNWDRLKDRFKDSLESVKELNQIETLARGEIEAFRGFGPPEAYERSKKLIVNPATEDPFWAQALYFAGTSIYNTGVFLEDSEVVYEASVDNGNIFPYVILMDFLVNTFVLTNHLSTQTDEVKLVMHVHPHNADGILEKNRFVQVSPLIKKYITLKEVEIDKK